MDIRNWNKVLLQWITKCNFVENNFFTIEQTNIDAFYQKICSHHKEASKLSTLQSLLQSHYPHFKPHLDDENALSAAEYIYVYSLLLHFCCVKCPEVYFQSVCQELSEQTQQSIRVFFEQIIAFPDISKDIIRRAIAEVSNVTAAAQQQKSDAVSSVSIASSNNGVNSTELQTSFSTSSQCLNGESPHSTPSRKTMSSIQRISPDTPKSSLLEERTRELYNYKAQLETERYEKNLLELQIKQNEKQIETMTHEYKILQHKIQELNDELLNRSVVPNVHDQEEDEMLEAMRRELLKKIKEKEQENFRLLYTINTLREEKALLEGKLRLAENKLASYREYIQELEVKTIELMEEIQKKDLKIKTLTDIKADLEHFIAESRSASGSLRTNFETSVDYLDASFSRYTNSSGSLGSPENLGASVVDVQLREKEHENNQLREELNELRSRQTELATFIQSKTKSFMQEYTIETNNNADIINGSEKSNDDAVENFNAYVDCMNHLGKLFKDAKNQTEKLEHDVTAMSSNNNELNNRIDEFESEINSLKEHIKALEAKNSDFLKEIEKLQELKQELAKNYENSINDYEARLKQSNDKNDASNEKIATLEKELEELNRCAQNSEAECNSLREKSANQNAKVQAHMEAERLVKAKYEQSLIENDGLRTKIRESDAHLETMRSNIQGKEVELSKLGKQIVQLGCINVELEGKIDKLTQNYKNDHSKHEAESQKLKSELLDLKKSYDKLQKSYDSVLSENETAFEKLEDLCRIFEVSSATGVDLITGLDSLRYAAQQRFEEQEQQQIEKLNLISEQDTEIKALNESLIKGEQKIKAFKTAVENLSTEVEKSKKTIDEMSLEVQELQAQTVTLNERHQAEQTEWSTKQEQLEAELKGEKEIRAAKEGSLVHITKQIEELNEKLQETQKLKFELETQVEILKKDKLHLEENLKAHEELKKAHESLQIQLTALKTELKNQISCLKNENENLTSKLEAEYELNAKQTAELEGIQLYLKALQLQHEQTKQDFEAQVVVLDETKHQLSAANAKMQQIEATSVESQKDFQQKQKLFELRVQELTNEIQRLVTEIQTCKDEQKATESEFIKTDDAFKKLSIQLEETKSMLATRNAKLEESQKMLNIASEKLANKSEILKTLQATCDKQSTELQQMSTKCEKLSTDLETSTTELEQLKSIKQTLQYTCDNQNDKIAKLKEKQTILKAEKENLTIKLQKMENDLIENKKVFEAKIENLTAEKTSLISKLEDTLTQKEDRINELESLMHDTEKCLKAVNEDSAKLQSELVCSNDALSKIKTQLETQTQIDRKLNAEQQSLKDELQKLEAVNEKMSQDNETLQLKLSNTETDLKTMQNKFGALRSLNERFSEKIEELDKRYLRDLEAIKAEQLTLVDQLNTQKLEYQALQKKNDDMQTEAAEAEAAAQQRLEQLECELTQCKNEKHSKEQEVSNQIAENKMLLEKYASLETKNAADEAQIAQLKKKTILLSVEFSELNDKHQHLYDEIQSVTSQLVEANTERTKNAEQLNKLQEEKQNLESDLQATQTQIKTLNDELEARIAQHKACQSEKQKVSEELNASQRHCHDLGKEINELKQKIALNGLEKDELGREMELLRKQVEVNSRYQTTSESKLKNIIETSQALERNLLSSENELKTMRTKLEQSKVNTEKLDSENQKLRDSAEALSKRIEKYAIKLGDAQALASKFERENEKINKLLSQQTANFETMQRERNALQIENKSMTERLNKLERLQEQTLGKLQAAEKTNASLIAVKKVLETNEVDLRAKQKKLENVRQMNEERLRKLTHDCERGEREMVNLNHQIGALNNEIYALKKAAKAEENHQKEELTKQLYEASTRASDFQHRNQELESQQNELKNQLETVTDKLSKIALTLEISNTHRSELNMTLEQMEMKLRTLQSDKVEFEKTQKTLTTRLKDSQDFAEQLLKDKRKLEEQLEALNSEMLDKNTEMTALRLELNDVRLSSVESTAAINNKTSALVAEIESLQARLKAIESLFAKEQETTAQLRLDNQILQAKYRDAKQRIEAEGSNTEERIKENRLELEGKLEKMKNKMKALYTEEVTKMKTKQERETATLRAELSTLKSQNSKYDEHTRKLSAELMSLNDRMLECQKVNTHLLTKLKYVQNEECYKFKRPNVSNAAPISSASSMQRVSSTQSVPSNIRSELAMEDEEGEVFNNTYLADLKNGRITQDICPEELMRRNSQLPPHLKSSYAPQYDHGLCEDEVKDGQSHGLDDSMSALIANNTSCTRKKISGVTHYRKPGPPTPSKNGGRLSFGGSSEPAREILKESYDDNGNAAGNKTPARFGFITSRFSMGSNNHTRDEHRIQKQEQNSTQTPRTPKCNNNQEDLRRIVHKKHKAEKGQNKAHVPSVTKILTSTPRQSKHRAHFIDKRRLINDLQNATESTPAKNATNEITLPEFSAIETSKAAKFCKRRSSIGGAKKIKPLSHDATSRGSIGLKVAELQRRIRRRRQRRERPSLCVQKNIYASKCCTPQRSVQRDLNRFIGRRDRRMNFDRQRGVFDVSSDDNESCLNQVAGTTATPTATTDATYEFSETNLSYKTELEDDDNDENYDCESDVIEEVSQSLALDVETIDGATYNCESIHVKCQTQTIIKSESKVVEEINYIDSPAVVVATTIINDSKNLTSIELHSFEEQLELMQSEIYPEASTSSACFERLLKETECQAPFKVDSLRLSENLMAKAQLEPNAVYTQPPANNVNSSINCSSGHSTEGVESKTKTYNSAIVTFLNTPTASQNTEKIFECVTPTIHRSTASLNQQTSAALCPRSSILHHSRTIYGASVIFNRRLPNIDAVQVRKSSIYFKNPKCSTFRASCNLSTIDSLGSATANGLSQAGDLILVTNQTITIFDLMCMWQQMSSSTRFLVGTILIGFLSTILALLHSFLSAVS